MNRIVNKNFKYLVTGCNGFIGRNLVKRLLSSGETVLGIDSNLIVENLALDNFEFLQVDITDFSNTLASLKHFVFENVIHLAASANVAYSVKNPLLDFDTNVKGTLTMLEVSRLKGIRKFVFPSTVSVFDPGNTQPVKEHYVILTLVKQGAKYFVKRITYQLNL